jgi:membrane associated rhomboid family serine protease
MTGLLPLVWVGLVLALLAFTIRAAVRESRRDRRLILAAGAAARGTIVSITPADGQGRCQVGFTVESAAGGTARRARQTTTAAAVARCGLMEGSGVDVRYLPTSPAAAFVPALVYAERLPAGASLPATPNAGPVFFISFANRTSSFGVSGTSTNRLRWFGSGDLTVFDDRVRIVVGRRRLLRTAAPVDREFARHDITDVETFGNAVTLSLREGERWVPLPFWAVDDAAAAALQRALSDTRSPRFAPAMAEVATFETELKALVPTTPVTYALVALNLAVFVLAATAGAGVFTPDPEVLVRLGSDYTPLTVDGQWWRLLTSTFLHFGVLHVGFNMWALASNGPLAERIFGSFRFLIIYLCAGIAGSAASLWWHPLVNGAGASGAIFGLFGALLAFFLRRHGRIPASVVQRHQKSVGIFIAYTLLNGVRIRGIDNAAHLGGLVGGPVIGLLLARPLERERDPPEVEWRWAAGLAALVVALTVASYRYGPRTDALLAGEGGTTPGAAIHPTVTELFGIRLGETRGEVLQQQGDPVRADRGVLVYNARGAGDDGVFEVHFHGHGGPADAVDAILYAGDAASAQPDLPYIIGRSPAALALTYRAPVWRRHISKDIDYLMYSSGLTAEVSQGKVRQYGIQSLYQGRARDR